MCRPYEVGGIPYFDGALGDTVPIRKAFELGCDKAVLILTKPKDFLRTPGKNLSFDLPEVYHELSFVCYTPM